MRKLLALMLFVLPFFPATATAGTTEPDKITTLNRMIDDPTQPPDCAPAGGRDVCTHTLYHYELDEHGKLYFVKLTATGVKGENTLQPGAASFSFICQLNALLLCEMPEMEHSPFDLSAYSIGEDGVKVHSALSPWENPQKAELFMAELKNQGDTALKAGDRSQSRMMDDLVCYVFDFNTLALEYKRYGHLIEDRSIRKLQPEGCLTSFETICGDPGSRADEIALAADARAGGEDRQKKSPINAADISRFCKSLKGIQAAMLR